MDIECEGWSAILQYYPDMNFDQECKDKPALGNFLVNAINANSVGLENPLEMADCPKLDNDFSKMVLLNGLPICKTEEKWQKLTQLLIKIANKNKLDITEDMIEMNFEGEGESKKTTGQACLTMNTDDQAKIIASMFNRHKLDKKHTFSACIFPEYEKIMAYGQNEQSAQSQKDQFLELNHHMLETRKTPYAFQFNKQIMVGALQGMNKILWNLDESEREKEIDNPFESDKLFQWSPRGTYLVLIKSDKVEFIGGSQMQPILAIPQPKVETVIFSPDERYITLYMPKKDKPYEVWNFQTGQKCREFDQQDGEDAYAFKWSHDGQFIARKLKKVIPKETEDDEEGQAKEDEEEEEEKYQTYISVYEHQQEEPYLIMTQDSDGNLCSIFVDGLNEFMWAPHRNVLIYTSQPEGAPPRINFMEMPSRRVIHFLAFKDSVELTMYTHPQGSYLALVNKYMERKKEKYSVELFETKEMRQNQIPNQQILVEREVTKFHSVVWEPHHAKIAIHTQSKKAIGADIYSNETVRNLVDIYQIKSSPTQGFQLKILGTLPSEKIQEVQFSGVGNILCTIDQEQQNKCFLVFYLINKISHEGQIQTAARVDVKKQKVQDQVQKLGAVDDTYEFQRISKHDVRERKWKAYWDQSGRFFMIQGRKATNFDRSSKSVHFYNILGELIDKIENVPQLDLVLFRNRATDILNADQVKKLKKNYVKEYGKMIDQERAQEKKMQEDIVKDKKKKIRDDFLDNFFIPLRREYEENIEEYKALFPIKESDYTETPETQVNIYQYLEEVSSRKLDIHTDGQ